MLARVRALDPFRADLLLAAALFLEQLLELAVLPLTPQAFEADGPDRTGLPGVALRCSSG